MKAICTLLLFCLGVATLVGCDADSFNPETLYEEIQEITVYDLSPFRKDLTAAELDSAVQVSINPAVFLNLIRQAEYSKKNYIWKGGSLAVVKMKDGSEIRLGFSYYGAFIRVMRNKGSFILPDNAGDAWIELYGKQIVQNVFIPNRRQKNEFERNGKIR